MLDLIFAASLAFQAPAPVQAAAPVRVPVMDACDTSSDMIAQVPRTQDMHVIYSIAGAPTCYLVTFQSAGKTVRGYIFDRHADAVMKFEGSRVAAEVEAFSVPAWVPPPPAPPEAPKTEVAKAAAEKKPQKPVVKASF